MGGRENRWVDAVIMPIAGKSPVNVAGDFTHP
jgi:hypothetical protein